MRTRRRLHAALMSTIGTALFAVLIAPTSVAAVGGDGDSSPDQARIDARFEEQPEQGAVEEADRSEVLGKDWSDSGDVAYQLAGTASGLTLLRAESSSGYEWAPVASLGDPSVETDRWIGNFCVVAGGASVAVVYATRTSTNDPELFEQGASAAVVDVESGHVTDLGIGYTIAHFNPGCGDGAIASFVGYADGGTRIGLFDTEKGEILHSWETEEELTSLVPTADGTVYGASQRGIEHVKGDEDVDLVAETESVPFDLTLGAGGTLAYIDHDFETSVVKTLPEPNTNARRSAGEAELATAPITDLGLGRSANGEVFVLGEFEEVSAAPDWVKSAPGTDPNAAVSSDGRLAVATPGVEDAELGAAEIGEADVRIESTAITTGADVVQDLELPQLISTTGHMATEVSAARLGPASVSAASTTLPPSSWDEPQRSCSVPRSDPRYQAYQPEPRQVEWAVNRAVAGDLNVQRPANWKSPGMPAYAPGQMFPKIPLTGSPGASIPSQVVLGVLMQESNLWQASRYTRPGLAGNPLIGHYYGQSSRDVTTASSIFWTVNFSEADCGYGVGQITDGMRTPAASVAKGQTALSWTQQRAIATDYTANVAKAVQMLTEKWNQTKAAGVTIHDADPNRLENWFYALWAYNTGFYEEGERADGRWGVGWFNNPANPRFDLSRTPFLEESSADAADPQLWPYMEKVLGFAAWPPDTIQTQVVDSITYATAFRPAFWNGGGRIGHDRRTAVKPPLDLFCDASTDCTWNTSLGEYNCSAPASRCWWHEPVSWKANCNVECGFGFTRYSSANFPNEQAPLGFSYPPACTREGLPSNAIVVDNLPLKNGTSGVIDARSASAGCSDVATSGTFEMNLGNKVNGYDAGKIDLHQLGGGFNGHFWFSHLRNPNGAGYKPPVITGKWTLGQSLNQWARIYVHMPDHGAWSQNAEYVVDYGDGIAEPRSLMQRHYDNVWVPLGVWDINGVPSVTLSNEDRFGTRLTDIAWDAIAIEPLSAKPDDFIVSLGDSYSSGEGAGDYYRSTDNNGESTIENGAIDSQFQNACHRSRDAWPRKMHAGGAAGESVGARADRNDRSLDFHFIACSGAVAANVLPNATQDGASRWSEGRFPTMQPQLSQGYLDENTTLVTMSLGGNDVGFGPVIEQCIKGPFEGKPPSCEYLRDSVQSEIVNLRTSLRSILYEVRDRAPNAKVLLVGYPNLFEAVSGSCVGMPLPALPWLRQMAIDLNAAIDQLAADFSFDTGAVVEFADPQAEFANHTLCSEQNFGGLPSGLTGIVLDITPGEDGKNLLAWRLPTGQYVGVSQQSIHPNDFGTDLYRNAVDDVLETMY